MTRAFGRNIPLSLPRRLICDYLHFAKKIPSVPVQRRMNLHELVTARAELSVRPSWCAIFTKAYAMVARERAPLRRAYLSFPRPHLYEHPINVISVAVERRYGDEDGVFFAPLRQPEEHTLPELEARLRELKEKPVEKFGSFRRGLYISRLPRPLRRFVWWVGLNVFGRKRAHYLGTAGVTVYAGLGAASLHPLSLLTTTLNYGVIEPDGGVDVRITYDHRVMDGATVARALADLDRVLHTDILAELRALAGQAPARGESHAA
jgi:hypothetical protein